MRTLLLLLLSWSLFAAAPTTTCISDKFRDPQGNLQSGRITITPDLAWQISSSGDQVAPKTIFVSVGTPGTFTVCLVPTDAVSVTGHYYNVTYTIGSQSTTAVSWNKVWVVPTSGSTLKIRDVEQAAPTGTAYNYLNLANITTPSTNPTSGYIFAYSKSSNPCWLNSSGTETCAAGVSGSITRGSIITAQGSSPLWAVLPPGSTGKVLAMGANEPAWTTLGSGLNTVLGYSGIPATAGLIPFASGTAGTVTTDAGLSYALSGTLLTATHGFYQAAGAMPSGVDNHALIIRTDASSTAPFDQAGSMIYRPRVSATAGRSSHIWYTSSPSTEKMRLNEAGNLLLGTTTDDAANKLQVAGSMKATSLTVDGGSPSGGLMMGPGIAAWPTVPAAGGFIGISASGGAGSFLSGNIMYYPRATDSIGYGDHKFFTGASPTERLKIRADGAILTYGPSITMTDPTAVTGSFLLTITPGAAQTAASTVLSVGGAATFGGDIIVGTGLKLGVSSALSLPSSGSQITSTTGGGSGPFVNTGNLVLAARATDTAGYGSIYFMTGASSTQRLKIEENGAATFASSITSNGHMLWTTDATYDIGASGATRPRNLYASGTGIFGGAVTATGYKTTTTTVASTATLTAVQTSGTVLSNYGQSAEATLTLPAAAEGLGLTFIVTTTGNALHIKAGASDKIYLDGAALDDGDKVSLATPAVGDAVSCLAFRSGESTWDWLCTSIAGAWTDGGA